MKKLLFLIFTSLLISSFTFDCEEYYCFHKGASFEFTIYNAKNKVDAINKYKVDDASLSPTSSKASISFVNYSEKGKEKFKGNFDVLCENGNYYVDAKNFISEEQTNAYKDFTLKITNQQNAEYPANMVVGHKLKDAEIRIDMLTKDGALFGNMECFVTNRVVLDKDTVITPAGTFTAFKIASDISSKAKIAGIGVPINMKSVEYFVPKFGMVKSISYDKSGEKIKSKQVLTQYSK
jgi:hypothetical protein